MAARIATRPPRRFVPGAAGPLDLEPIRLMAAGVFVGPVAPDDGRMDFGEGYSLESVDAEGAGLQAEDDAVAADWRQVMQGGRPAGGVPAMVADDPQAIVDRINANRALINQQFDVQIRASLQAQQRYAEISTSIARQIAATDVSTQLGWYRSQMLQRMQSYTEMARDTAAAQVGSLQQIKASVNTALDEAIRAIRPRPRFVPLGDGNFVTEIDYEFDGVIV
jgi:hypothetical protein